MSYHDLLSRQFKKEIEKRRPTVYMAYLAKQMQIRARVMHDATRLLQEKDKNGTFHESDKAEYFTFSHDEELPFKADDSSANNLLGLVGQALRTYEIGKLVKMGYTNESVRALFDQFSSSIEFPDAIQLMIDKQHPTKHKFVGSKVSLGQFKVALIRTCIICGHSEREHQ